jgi:hypothetical protein
MGHRIWILCVFIFAMLGNGWCQGQSLLGFTNADGFPQVIAQGNHYDVSGWIINRGTVAFSGALGIYLKPDSSSVLTLDNNFTVSNALLPGDSILWTRNNYNFPPGHFRLGNNDVLIWPTSPVIGLDVDYDTISAVIYSTESAAFRLANADFDVYPDGLELLGSYDINASATNWSQSVNAHDVCLYAKIPGKAAICLDRETGQYGYNDVALFDAPQFKIWDRFGLAAADTLGGVIDQITFYALETDTSLNPLNEVVLPVNRIVGVADAMHAPRVGVYPNPFTTVLHIDIPADCKADAMVQLRDLAGRLVMQQRLQASTLDLSNLPAGSYLLEIQSRKVHHRQQVICR